MSKPVLVADVVFKRPFADVELHRADAARCVVDCSSDPGYTVQAAREDADINEIVRRFGMTGDLPVAQFPSHFGDFSSGMSFHEAMNQVAAARASFLELPADVRRAFGNDPGALIAALEAADSDSEVRAQLEELGLVEPSAAAPVVDAGASVAPVAPVAAVAPEAPASSGASK